MITTKQLVYTIVEIVKHYLIEAGDYSNDLEEQYSIRETESGFKIDGYYICDYEYIPIFVDESKIPESYEKVNKNNFFSLRIEDCTDIGEVINKISKTFKDMYVEYLENTKNKIIFQDDKKYILNKQSKITVQASAKNAACLSEKQH